MAWREIVEETPSSQIQIGDRAGPSLKRRSPLWRSWRVNLQRYSTGPRLASTRRAPLSKGMAHLVSLLVCFAKTLGEAGFRSVRQHPLTFRIRMPRVVNSVAWSTGTLSHSLRATDI